MTPAARPAQGSRPRPCYAKFLGAMEDSADNSTVREPARVGRDVSQPTLRWVWPREQVVTLQGARLLIGRDAAADIRLDGSGVSRQHAELYRQGPLYVLKDLASTNGTWVGGRQVEHSPVSPGQVVRVGDWVGIFTLERPDETHFSEVAPGLFGGREVSALVAPLGRAAKANLNVLLVGSTGTGKERFARVVHHFSERKGPFCAVNCAAVPEQLAEAEFFGYRRGAFTGAERAAIGHFRAANGGTLFLDEVAELSPSLQAKLLRVLEDRKVMGLGEAAAVDVDLQVVAAVQKPIHELVAAGRFREDLAARLNGLSIGLPLLGARKADVPALFRHFMNVESGGRALEVESRVVEALCLHEWPQNVRELETTTKALVALHGHEPLLKLEHLPEHLAGLLHEPDTKTPEVLVPRARREHDLEKIGRELERNGGNVKATAEALGIPRQRVYRLLNTSQQCVPRPDEASEE